MHDRRLPWLLSVPLMAAGCLGAHSAAYRLVEPSPAEAAHGYLALAPLPIALAAAIGMVAAVRSVLAGKIRGGAPIYAFAILPPLAFSLQEYLERALHGGAAPLEIALEPAFLLGLALQLPFALCSLALARGVFHVAEAAGALLHRRRVLPRRCPIALGVPREVDVPRVSALASPHAGRAPPLSA
jgi:hypothetical protein